VKSSRTATAFLLLGLVLAGCKSSDDTKKPESETKGPIAIADDDLTTAVDFEEAAEKSIDAKNYKAELAAIEETIAKP
jgi:hypothetical protein